MTKTVPAAAIVPRMIGSEGDVIMNALSFARSHLGMEIAYMAQIVDDDLVFEAAIAPGFEATIAVGQKLPLELTLCQHIIQGRLPELISDTVHIPLIKTLGVMKKIDVRSHVSIPIHRIDGSLYGVFCCLDRTPRQR